MSKAAKSVDQPERLLASGKIFELVQQEQSDGRVFEVARRAPGVRLIIADEAEKKVLLTREFRRELNAWDYRLPGGKVFDTLEEYQAFRQTGQDMLIPAMQKAKEEGLEEAGIVVDDVKLFKKSTLGATVEWDLYIFEVTAWRSSSEGQKLEAGESIESDHWFSYGEAGQMILSGEMQEERVALGLLQWLKVQEAK